jgi:SAM-dependent methyltransferase
MDDPDYRQIVDHYERCLARHGDTHLGVDWPRLEDAETRYRVMLDLIPPDCSNLSVLDFGCGAGHLYEFLRRHPRPGLRYSGLDLSGRFVELCRSKYPDVEFFEADLLKESVDGLTRPDFVIANGVFTEKRGLGFDPMLGYFEALVSRLFALARVGIAFNVMSSHVDWERDDLFHLPIDTLARFLTRDLSRHFVIRNDYGLYEYTVYAYREPQAWPGSSSSA